MRWDILIVIVVAFLYQQIFGFSFPAPPSMEKKPPIGKEKGPMNDFDCSFKAVDYYPHPKYCTRYVGCMGWRGPVEKECPKGPDKVRLHFKVTGRIMFEESCVSPETAGCQIESTDDEDEKNKIGDKSKESKNKSEGKKLGPMKDFSCKEKSVGFYTHPNLCTRYVYCGLDGAVEFECQEDENKTQMHFKANRKKDDKVCEPPDKARCEMEHSDIDDVNGTVKSGENVKSVEGTRLGDMRGYKCEGKGVGFFPHPTLCTRYVYCGVFGAAEMACGYSWSLGNSFQLYYHRTRKHFGELCVAPDKADCKLELSDIDSNDTIEEQEPVKHAEGTQLGRFFLYDCTGKDAGYYPHPALCTRYVYCGFKGAYEMECDVDEKTETRMQYNFDRKPFEKICVPPTESHCKLELSNLDTSSSLKHQEPVKETEGSLLGIFEEYNCTTKDVGFYPHPMYCGRYVYCGMESAYEMECDNDTETMYYNHMRKPFEKLCVPKGDTMCPMDQMKHEDPLENVTESTQSTTTTTPAPNSNKNRNEDNKDNDDNEDNDPSPPDSNPSGSDPNSGKLSGDSCDPLSCKLDGYCISYKECIPQADGSGQLLLRNCSRGLYWFPDELTGGTCAYYGNLPEDIQRKYKNDRQCIQGCEWLQSPEDICSPRYIFRSAFKEDGSDREHHLFCPDPPAGKKPLFWVQASLSCDICDKAVDSSGDPCDC